MRTLLKRGAVHLVMYVYACMHVYVNMILYGIEYRTVTYNVASKVLHDRVPLYSLCAFGP